jgi:hypothetical protein
MRIEAGLEEDGHRPFRREQAVPSVKVGFARGRVHSLFFGESLTLRKTVL